MDNIKLLSASAIRAASAGLRAYPKHSAFRGVPSTVGAAGGSASVFLRLSERRQRLGQRPSEPVHLVDEMQDHVEPLVVDPHIVLKVADETRAREVHLGVGPLRRR